VIRAAGAPDSPRATQVETEAGRGEPGEDGAEPVSVLIVEDEWLISMEIEAALSDAGYVVVGTAVSAEEAVSLAIARRPDLVLMDIRLEGLRDGVEAAGEIHERLGTRCIFISANADPATRRRAETARPLGWLPKPFSSRQLVEAVANAVGGPAHRG
jgi:DNA-binding NarL/FixJ family response regulator